MEERVEGSEQSKEGGIHSGHEGTSRWLSGIT